MYAVNEIHFIWVISFLLQNVHMYISLLVKLHLYPHILNICPEKLRVYEGRIVPCLTYYSLRSICLDRVSCKSNVLIYVLIYPSDWLKDNSFFYYAKRLYWAALYLNISFDHLSFLLLESFLCNHVNYKFKQN